MSVKKYVYIFQKFWNTEAPRPHTHAKMLHVDLIYLITTEKKIPCTYTYTLFTVY